jgi:hypothetical protein
MRQIGYYYADDGLFNLYDTGMFAYNWVTNICYYNTRTDKYFSPNMKNLINNGRNLSWDRFTSEQLLQNISSAHQSFVMN